jgi:Flp pilus assembly protein TadD
VRFHLFDVLTAPDAPAAAEAPTDHQVLSALHRAAREAPLEADYRWLLGKGLAAQGRAQEAVPWLQDAARLAPEIPAIQVELGRALHAAGRVTEAVAGLRDVARARPDDLEVANALGLAFLGMGEAGDAVGVFEEVLRVHPRAARVWSNLGAALAAQGRAGDAVRAFRRAAKLDPGSADAHSNLALALEAHGDGPGALAALRQAVRLEPGQARRRVDLADCLHRRGRRSQAMEAYEAALSLDPSCLTGRPESQAARTDLVMSALRDESAPAGRRVGSGVFAWLAHGGEVLAHLARRRHGLDLAGTLLLVAAVGHAGIALLTPWARHYVFLDEAVRIARLPTADEAEVRRQLVHAVRKHGLAPHLDGERCEVRTGRGVRQITCSYVVPIDLLPGLPWLLTFRLLVDEPFVSQPAPVIL